MLSEVEAAAFAAAFATGAAFAAAFATGEAALANALALAFAFLLGLAFALAFALGALVSAGASWPGAFRTKLGTSDNAQVLELGHWNSKKPAGPFLMLANSTVPPGKTRFMHKSCWSKKTTLDPPDPEAGVSASSLELTTSASFSGDTAAMGESSNFIP